MAWIVLEDCAWRRSQTCVFLPAVPTGSTDMCHPTTLPELCLENSLLEGPELCLEPGNN